ncbi:hypothetical protein DFH28DRAFT_930932 [Melampsora americana]|nr:hypothetical protein DFH28DRAFT_930932 [Melampsora americana]
MLRMLSDCNAFKKGFRNTRISGPEIRDPRSGSLHRELDLKVSIDLKRMTFNFLRSTLLPKLSNQRQIPIRSRPFNTLHKVLIHNQPRREKDRISNKSKWIGMSSIILIISTITFTGFYLTQEPIFSKEIKEKLRIGIISEGRGDLMKSNEGFKEAYELGKSKKIELNKLSGIGIRWGLMLERSLEVQEAKKVYLLVFKDLEDGLQSVKDEEEKRRLKMRMISIAQKLSTLSDDQDEIEGYLTWSVEEILKLSLPELENRSNSNSIETQKVKKDGIILGEIDLPEWVKSVELGSCLESLGEFYAKNGKPEYSLTLYLQALSILLPPKPRKREPTILEKCHASILMNNISQLHLQTQPKMIDECQEWLKKSLDLILSIESKILNSEERFESVKNRMVIEENLGSLEEMRGEFDQAKEKYRVSQQMAHQLGIQSWIDRSDENLKRINLKLIK